jgi:hypothetical protein
MSATAVTPGQSTAAAQQARLVKMLTRVMDTLDKWDERLSGHYAPQRKHQRNDVRLPVDVRIPVPGMEPQAIAAWMRNVSSGGMSFVSQAKFDDKKILVGLKMDGVNESWFHGEVMRAREVVDDFWEYGIAFRGKAL